VVKGYVDLGAQSAASPKEVAEKSSIIMSSLPTPPIVKDVYLGKEGVVEGIKSGSMVVEFSTIDPATMREVAKALKEKGVELLAAPVSGSGKESQEGKLLFWVGGNSNTFTQCKEVMSALGSSLYCGEDPGTASAIKLVNKG
jgi:2-hydroxy-3-oxopropionate reductase